MVSVLLPQAWSDGWMLFQGLAPVLSFGRCFPLCAIECTGGVTRICIGWG